MPPSSYQINTNYHTGFLRQQHVIVLAVSFLSAVSFSTYSELKHAVPSSPDLISQTNRLHTPLRFPEAARTYAACSYARVRTSHVRRGRERGAHAHQQPPRNRQCHHQTRRLTQNLRHTAATTSVAIDNDTIVKLARFLQRILDDFGDISDIIGRILRDFKCYKTDSEWLVS